MIERLFRRLTVRRRIVGGFLVLVLLSALSAPLIVANHRFLVGRLRQIANVETRADRMLLLAATRIESSRVNLMRYVQDYAPSPRESLDDVDQAVQLLTEAQDLIASPDQKAAVAMVLEALTGYKKLIGDVEAARLKEEGPNVSRLLFQVYRLGNDIGQRIEQIVSESETRVAAANEAVYAEAQRRLIFLIAGYVGVLILALILASLVQRSITQPVADLRNGAEAFRLGHMDTTIPVVGTDELSLLAQAFNQMTAQLRDLIGTLEQRVAERTRGLQAAAEVSRATTSVLNPDELLRQVVDLVRERFDLYYVGLFLLDKERRFAVLRAGTGEAGRQMMAQGHRLEVGGMTMIGQCVAKAEARIALDESEETVRLDNPLLPETRSEMALPLRSRGRVFGAMTVQSVEKAAFDEADIAIMQTMADQVAVAIDNARLFAEAQAALEEMAVTQRHYLSQAWAAYTPTRAISGYEQTPTGLKPLGDEVLPQVQRAMVEQRTVIWNGDQARDDAGSEHHPATASGPGGDTGQAGESSPTLSSVEPSALVAPILLRGQPIGALGFKREGQQWSAEDVALIEAITEQLALAADNLRLLDETQRRAAREQLISEVTARIRETLDLETVLKTAAQEVRQALGLPEVVIRLATKETDDGSPPDNW